MMTTLTPVQENNIQTYLYALPTDIKENIKECTDKWLSGESAYGYPHPVHVCENIQAANARQPFLSVQQLVDLQFLKNHLRQALQ